MESPGVCQRRIDRLVAGRIGKTHHDVGVADDGRQPATEGWREIEGGERPFSDDDRVNELHRDMLRIGRRRTASERQQSTAAQKSRGHFLTRMREAFGLAIEERPREWIPRHEALGNERSYLGAESRHSPLTSKLAA